MKISTQTDPLVPKLGLEKAMALISYGGFEAVDFGFDYSPLTSPMFREWDDRQFADYFKHAHKTAAENGIEIHQCHAPFPLKVYDPEKDPVMLEAAVKSIYASAYMECPYIIIHPAMNPKFHYGNNYDECLSTNVEFYSALVPALRDTGVSLCVENMWACDVDTGKKIATTCSRAEWMVDMIDTLNGMHGGEIFTACLDVGHCAISGSYAHDMVRTLGKRIHTLHVHDNDGYDDSHQLPGLGKINWLNFMNALKDVGYSGTFNFEAGNFFGTWSNSDLYDDEVLRAASKMMCAVGRSLVKILEK